MSERRRGFALLELVALIVLLVVLSAFFFPVQLITTGSSGGKQINNCKQIITACSLYAADVGAGRYPTGNYDPEKRTVVPDKPAGSAEECFQDLFDVGIVDWEALADAGTIAEKDLDLFRFVETAEDAIELIENWEPAPPRDEVPGR